MGDVAAALTAILAPPAEVKDPRDDSAAANVQALQAFGAVIAALNGAAHAEPVKVELMFVAKEKRVRIPEFLTTEAANLGRDIIRGFCHPDDVGALLEPGAFHGYKTIWGLRADDEKDEFSWVRQQRLKPATILAIAALNLELCGGHALTALCLGYAVSMGLVNLGGDGYTREWVTTNDPGSGKDLLAVTALHKAGDTVTTLVGDRLAFVGYCRISRTHLFSGKDVAVENSGATIDMEALTRMIVNAGLKVETYGVPPDRAVEVLYTGTHCYSLGGAIGFFYAWINSGKAGALMKIRDQPLGDIFKPIAIANAGYDNLCYLPRIGTGLLAFEAYRIGVKTNMANMANQWHRTSSLSNLICGEPPFPTEMCESTYCRTMSAMIAGACDAKYLPRSLATSYYIKRISKEQKAVTELWSNLFAGYDKEMSSAAISDTMAEIIPGDKIVFDAGEVKPLAIEYVIDRPEPAAEAAAGVAP